MACTVNIMVTFDTILNTNIDIYRYMYIQNIAMKRYTRLISLFRGSGQVDGFCLIQVIGWSALDGKAKGGNRNPRFEGTYLGLY